MVDRLPDHSLARLQHMDADDAQRAMAPLGDFLSTLEAVFTLRLAPGALLAPEPPAAGAAADEDAKLPVIMQFEAAS